MSKPSHCVDTILFFFHLRKLSESVSEEFEFLTPESSIGNETEDEETNSNHKEDKEEITDDDDDDFFRDQLKQSAGFAVCFFPGMWF